jgi:two-component system cell cycle response regulator
MLKMRIVIADDESAYNERVGRSFGDEVLRCAADRIRNAVGPEDTAVRYGPDEFLVLLPATHFIGAVRIAEQIWRAFVAKEWPSRAGERAVSLSVGISLFPSRDVRFKETLLQCADFALARAKRDGMNRICVFQQHGMVYTPHVYGRP